MNTKTKAVVIGSLVALMALPVFAQTGGTQVDSMGVATVTPTAVGGKAGENVAAKQAERMTKGKARADQEIKRRIKVLNDLNARVQDMKNVSATSKSGISGEVQSEITNLTALNAKIQADTDIDTLKTDIKSIATSYRIFMLIIPQGRITVATDRIHTVADSMTEYASKLKTRIDSVAGEGKDVTTMNASLTVMNAKIASADANADGAVALVVGLVPDGGDKTKMDANNSALKSARGKIKVAMDDLKVARENSKSIMKALHAMGVAQSVSASSTAPGQN